MIGDNTKVELSEGLVGGGLDCLEGRGDDVALVGQVQQLLGPPELPSERLGELTQDLGLELDPELEFLVHH